MQSVWLSNVELPKFPKFEGYKSVDVLIIGGGLAGLLTAYFLEQNGVDYMLLEGDRVAHSTTGNTTAKITFQHGLIYQKLLKNFGIEGAQKYLKINQQAFLKYEELANDIDCDYEVKDNYVYSLDDRIKLENELKALESIGYKAELCDKLPLKFKTAGAVKFSAQAQFNPLKFLSEIIKNLNIYECTKVKEMIGNIAVCDKAKIKAKKVIVTTHFPFINKHGSFFLKLYQHRSYVLALQDAQNVKGMYVDENNKGMSFRNCRGLLLLSGGGHRTGKNGGNWAELRRFAKQYYPKAIEKYCWAAQDCMSLDSVPYIGQYSKNTPDLLVATGFNKWGVSGSMVAAMILSDMCLEKQNDCADIFNPSRNILKPQLLVNSAEAVGNLLSFKSKRCPHLGCALKWNKTEHSWDCACHGSRFTEDGRVLNNPANTDIKR